MPTQFPGIPTPPRTPPVTGLRLLAAVLHHKFGQRQLWGVATSATSAMQACLVALLPSACAAAVRLPPRFPPFDPATTVPVGPSLRAGTLPRLIVFDLDGTVWTPELYQLRHIEGYASSAPPGPVAGEDVVLFPGAAAALHELATAECWAGTQLAVASRTNKGPWARALLGRFRVPGLPDPSSSPTLDELLPHKEIYTGAKVAHFEALRRSVGCGYGEMLFFDDAGYGQGHTRCTPTPCTSH